MTPSRERSDEETSHDLVLAVPCRVELLAENVMDNAFPLK
jgi:hypothetical protein